MKQIPAKYVVVVILAAVCLVIGIGIVYYRSLPTHPDSREYMAVMAAAKTYIEKREAAGLPVPPSVTVRELISSGAISKGDIPGFQGLEVTISLEKPAQTPLSATLMRVRFPDGKEIVALNDGSVQQLGR